MTIKQSHRAQNHTANTAPSVRLHHNLYQALCDISLLDDGHEDIYRDGDPDLRTDLYTILQILSLTLFEKTPLEQILTNCDYKTEGDDMCKQLNLFDNLTGQY